MARPIRDEDWIQLMRQEYLAGFIREGGAAVRFVLSPDSSARTRVCSLLRDAAGDEGYAFTIVDSAKTRVHMIDKVFNCVATQLDWRALARLFVIRLLRDSNYNVPQENQALSLASLADMNGCAQSQMRVIINKRLTDALFHDYRMTQELRIAMLWLCREQIDPGEVPAGLGETIHEWLFGNLRLITALRQALIFQRIGRHNGRHMLFSLARWLYRCTGTGLVVVLDIEAVVIPHPRSSEEDLVNYSKSAVLDTYEALRQFVDGTGELGHAMVFVLVPPQFVAEEERRSVFEYEALRYRVLTEVRDKRVSNPLASLVSLVEASTVDQ